MAIIINLPKFEALDVFPIWPVIMIRIGDPAQYFTPLKHEKRFHSIHEFEFLDAEDGFDEGFLFTKEQAKSIMDILVKALDEDIDVVVHCNMGRCRSGAVAEIGVIMGFTDAGRPRQPNLLVKRLLINEAIERNLI